MKTFFERVKRKIIRRLIKGNQIRGEGMQLVHNTVYKLILGELSTIPSPHDTHYTVNNCFRSWKLHIPPLKMCKCSRFFMLWFTSVQNPMIRNALKNTLKTYHWLTIFNVWFSQKLLIFSKKKLKVFKIFLEILWPILTRAKIISKVLN